MPLNASNLTTSNTVAEWLDVTNLIVDFLDSNTVFGNTTINGTLSVSGVTTLTTGALSLKLGVNTALLRHEAGSLQIGTVNAEYVGFYANNGDVILSVNADRTLTANAQLTVNAAFRASAAANNLIVGNTTFGNAAAPADAVVAIDNATGGADGFSLVRVGGIDPLFFGPNIPEIGFNIFYAGGYKHHTTGGGANISKAAPGVLVFQTAVSNVAGQAANLISRMSIGAGLIDTLSSNLLVGGLTTMNGNVTMLGTGVANGFTVNFPGGGGFVVNNPAADAGVTGQAYGILQTAGVTRWYYGMSAAGSTGNFDIYNNIAGLNVLQINKTTSVVSFANGVIVSGNSNVVGTFGLSGPFQGSNNSNTGAVSYLYNANTGTAAFAELDIQNSSGATVGLRLLCMGENWTNTGVFFNDSAVIRSETDLGGGLCIVVANTSANLRFAHGSTQTATMNLTHWSFASTLVAGKLTANSTVIAANSLVGFSGTFVANGVANTVTVTNGLITGIA